jgi:hypothetical protein
MIPPTQTIRACFLTEEMGCFGPEPVIRQQFTTDDHIDPAEDPDEPDGFGCGQRH